MEEIVLDGESLTMALVDRFLSDDLAVALSAAAMERVEACHRFCRRLAEGEEAVYGVNTGFGQFARTRIEKGKLTDLQVNLLRSHAVGMGEYLEPEVVRLMMLLRLNSLLRGHSGVSTETVRLLGDVLNRGIVPAVPRYGSVGASGDLAPLAHVALALVGEGRVFHRGELKDSSLALQAEGLRPLTLQPKEGLALINGTQLMSSLAARELLRMRNLLKSAMVAAAMGLEAVEATDRVFDEKIARLKGHPGVAVVAAGFRKLLEGSQIVSSHRNCTRVQDPYSFRCLPQVLGAVADMLGWVEGWVEKEMNASTDNPLLFADDGEVLSGGNFHGEHMAFALDALALAAAETASMAERRIDKLLDNDNPRLPQCLISDPGLNSGLMVTQYLAAALVAENRVLAHPASVDSIPTSAGFEDHVSMGSIAGLKLARVVENTTKVLAVEAICAAQALDFLCPLEPGRGTGPARELIRNQVPFIERDTALPDFLQAVEAMISAGEMVAAAERAVGDLLEGG